MTIAIQPIKTNLTLSAPPKVLETPKGLAGACTTCTGCCCAVIGVGTSLISNIASRALTALQNCLCCK